MAKEEKKTKVKEPAKKPEANSLSKQRIEKLFRMFCIHREHYIKGFKYGDTLKDCSACILRDIPYVTEKRRTEDLCFAIWHEGILNA